MKYTPEVVEAICVSIRDGCTQKDAALAAGISEETFYEWIKSKPEFSESLKKADGEMVRSAVGCIRKAAESGQWTAAAWLLERRHPQNFGHRTVLSNDAEQGGRLKFTINLAGNDADEESE